MISVNSAAETAAAARSISGKKKRAFPQALVIQHEARAVPEQHLDPVSVAIAKHEQMPAQRVPAHHVLRQSKKPVKTAARDTYSYRGCCLNSDFCTISVGVSRVAIVSQL